MAWTVAAVAVPTLIRVAVDGFVSGCELTIYLPFVLFAAIFMGSRYAAATAIASAIVARLVLLGGGHDLWMGSCDAYSVGVLLIGSAAIIGVVHAFRSVIAHRFEAAGLGNHSKSGIIFSERDGTAWASWNGLPMPVPLGQEEEVTEMMEDFLKQVQLGKRLNKPRG
jgi:hypothetical protein